MAQDRSKRVAMMAFLVIGLVVFLHYAWEAALSKFGEHHGDFMAHVTKIHKGHAAYLSRDSDLNVNERLEFLERQSKQLQTENRELRELFTSYKLGQQMRQTESSNNQPATSTTTASVPAPAPGEATTQSPPGEAATQSPPEQAATETAAVISQPTNAVEKEQCDRYREVLGPDLIKKVVARLYGVPQDYGFFKNQV